MTLHRRLDQRLETLPNSIWTLITQIEAIKGEWSAGVHLSPQILGELKRSVLVTSTGASTRIEGAHLSDEDVEKLMRGLSVQKFADRDKQEVQGYYELLEKIFEAWETLSLSEGTIKQLHKETLKYVEKDKLHRGDYKKRENKVQMINEAGESVGVLFDTTPAYLTPKEMLELVEWTQQAFEKNKFHPLLIIGNFLVEFLNIHPFQDGNGRVSRILTHLLLLRHGYHFVPYVSHEKLIEENKADYYLALRKSQKTFKTSHADITPWLDFFLKIVLEQAKKAIDLINREKGERFLSPKQLAILRYLETILEATPGEISKKTKISRPTVNQALNRLLQQKLIERMGQGRSTRYQRVK